jgi:hypothetical protein
MLRLIFCSQAICSQSLLLWPVLGQHSTRSSELAEPRSLAASQPRTLIRRTALRGPGPDNHIPEAWHQNQIAAKAWAVKIANYRVQTSNKKPHCSCSSLLLSGLTWTHGIMVSITMS